MTARALAVVLALALSPAGCAMEELTPAPGADLATAPPDLLADAALPPQADRPIDLRFNWDLTIIIRGCHGAVLCVDKCPSGDFSCYDNCVDHTTPTGRLLFDSLSNCLEAACPSKHPNEICWNGTPACAACYAKAQALAGACTKQKTECEKDLP
ncbi:MAG: hypothetical protein EXR72_12420 [Myxococcales bacterium]|nr:hypothetical protein [Myxococcales bacterium]